MKDVDTPHPPARAAESIAQQLRELRSIKHSFETCGDSSFAVELTLASMAKEECQLEEELRRAQSIESAATRGQVHDEKPLGEQVVQQEVIEGILTAANIEQETFELRTEDVLIKGTLDSSAVEQIRRILLGSSVQVVARVITDEDADNLGEPQTQYNVMSVILAHDNAH